MSTKVEIRARAPLRISLAGGGTDIPPYPHLHGGAVLSLTIDLSARVRMRAPSSRVTVSSPDLRDGEHRERRADLVRATLAAFGATADVEASCDVPPGSGLGASSALAVALGAAAAALHDDELDPGELARRAVFVERTKLALPGGLQDAYAAAFGGVNYIRFEGDDV
ncbi:MAG: GHMP kinase, partial [Actinomycetota bacterium]|nr:GHMP kinase [Actinomycetota bacterium]